MTDRNSPEYRQGVADALVIGARAKAEKADALKRSRAAVEAQATRSRGPIPGALTSKLDSAEPTPKGADVPEWQRPLRMSKSAGGFNPFGGLRAQRAASGVRVCRTCGLGFDGSADADTCPGCTSGPRAA